MQAYRFALDPTPAQARALASHAGAARFAYNWGLALVKDRLEARSRVRAAALGEQLADQEVERLARSVEVPWTLAALRREWNRSKGEIASWWAQNSKEAAVVGARGSRGRPQSVLGLQVRSPCRRADRLSALQTPRPRASELPLHDRVLRLCGRVRLQLPPIGHVRTHEPTTKLRKLNAGRARVLSATVAREGDRWFCSLCCEVDRADRWTAKGHGTVGVDAGVRHLAVLSTGEKIANPRALERAQRRLRRYQRKLDRQRRANNPDCYDSRGRAITGKRPLNRSIVVERLNARGLCRAGNRVRDSESQAAPVRADIPLPRRASSSRRPGDRRAPTGSSTRI